MVIVNKNTLTKRIKAYLKLKNNPKNIRFIDFIKYIELFGFVLLPQRRGSHKKYRRNDIPVLVIVQPNKYDKMKAPLYQVKNFIKLIDEYYLLDNE